MFDHQGDLVENFEGFLKIWVSLVYLNPAAAAVWY